ncbi:MAG: NAD-dependent epimerase/dehydratase family protein [Aquabacterium sp.]
MKTLVTGGGGFLGRYIVEALQARGHEVTVLCRGDYPALRRQGTRLIQADLADMQAVYRACIGIERVFHVASKTGPWGRHADFHRTNVLGTHHLIEACKAAGVHKLIYTSSPSAVIAFDHLRGVDERQPYPRQVVSAYQRSKMIAEKMVLAAHGQGGLVTTALRPHAIWGPRDTQLLPALIERHRAGKLVRVGPGGNRISVSYVENAAWWHLQAADAEQVGGKVYFVNEPEPVDMWAWIDDLLRAIGLPPVRRQVSYRAAFAIGAASEALCTLMPRLGEPRLTRAVAAVCAKDHYFDTGAAQRDFGLYSPIAMPEARRRFAAYFGAPAKLKDAA